MKISNAELISCHPVGDYFAAHQEKTNKKKGKKTMCDLKTMIKDKKVYFCYYREKELWYTTECGFNFPVPIEDVGNAVFKREDKAILFMRWIRKQIECINKAKQYQ